MEKENGVQVVVLNVIHTKVTTWMIKSVALANFNGLQATPTKVSIKTTSETAMARCIGQMAAAIKENGLKAFSTVMAA